MSSRVNMATMQKECIIEYIREAKRKGKSQIILSPIDEENIVDLIKKGNAIHRLKLGDTPVELDVISWNNKDYTECDECCRRTLNTKICSDCEEYKRRYTEQSVTPEEFKAIILLKEQ